MHQSGATERLVRGDRSLGAPALTLVAWAVGLAVTSAILGTPYLVFGYHNPSLHLVLDTVDGCVAFLLSFLVYGRYLRSRGLRDLLLAEGLFLLGLAGLALSLVLPYVGDLPARTVDVWLPLSIRVVAALLILTASLVGERVAPRLLPGLPLLLPWLLVVVLLGVFWFTRGWLPVAIDDSPPESAVQPVIEGHALLLLGQVVGALCFLIASVLFTVHAERRHDELLLWLGPACALGGFARVSYVLFPSLYSDWLYTGDFLRTACYLVLLIGAGREISRYWSAQARAAVLEDRRRLARELHDGVVQELGYIRAESHAIAGHDGLRERILGAVDRGLDEARAAVDALGHSSDEPLAFVLHRAARQVADRYGARVVVDLDDAVDADQTQRHALVRITREAVSNAIRHGRAECIRIRLERDSDGRRLVVEDDGRGFDVGTTSGTGYGLTSMRERAEALPGSFELKSVVGDGTTLGVTW